MGHPVDEQITENTFVHRRLNEKILEIDKAVKSFGIRMECRTDFSEFRKTARLIPEKRDVTAVFDDRYCDIGPENGFWIKAKDQSNEIIHIQSMRHDDLTGTTLARHWLQSPFLFAPAGLDVVIHKCNFDTAPASHTISGKVCYHGDFWLKRDFRKLELAPFLSKYAILFALTRFSPDYIYGLIPPKLVERGWAARQGYLHMHPWAPRWHIRGVSEYYDDYLVWVSGRELVNLWTARKRDIDVLSRINVANNHRAAIAKHVGGQ